MAVRLRADDGTFLAHEDEIGAERWKSSIYQTWAQGIKSSTIRQRYYVYGWPIERCLETPVLHRGVE